MQPLTGLDASFLYLEQPHMPMHVGSVLVFEGSMKFDEFRQVIAARLHLVPRMQQRLVEVPLGLGNPYWVDDPAFDIDLHLQHIALPRPGGWRQLRELASRMFAVPLARQRALWEFAFVEGLDTIAQVPSGSVALISKVHHAAIDGVSGADMLGILFDVEPTPRPVAPAPPRRPAAVPHELTLVASALRSLAGKPLQVPGLIRNGLRAARAGSAVRAKGLEAPPTPYTAPHSPINRAVSSKRSWNTALLSLDRVKAIRATIGCTLNDVVLAICAGALRRHLLDAHALPDEPLVAMMPVSTRSAAGHGAMGNQVSATLVQLATQIADPLERLQAIHRNTVSAKSYQSAIGARTLSDAAEFIPFGLAGAAARLYTRFNVAEKIRPIFNLVITNVPGPQTALYVAGHKLLANMGMAPIIDGMGLIITVLSYNGVISLSPISSPAVMPDLDGFARQLRESANELEAAVAKLAPVVAPAPVAGNLAASTAEFFGRIRESLERATAPGTATFQFRVTGSAVGNWVVALGDRKVTEGEAANPSATFTVRDDHLAQILRGELDPQMAFVQGKLRVKGDVAQAAAFGKLMPSSAA
jgi:diacylglycerol O-acyltransferase